MSVQPAGPALPPGGATFVDLLRWRSHEQPDRRAFTFLVDGEDNEQHVSYADLDQQARLIGAALQEQAEPGMRALLLYPSGLEYVAAFFGCLYAGVIAVPAYPPNPARLERTLPRLARIVADSQPTVVLTTAALAQARPALAAANPAFGQMHWIATDTLGPQHAEMWQPPRISGDSVAFLQYTSGSTALPKGVVLSHANLLSNSAVIQRCFGHSTASRGVIWLPPYHDMGLIGGILQPLYVGFPVTLMSPTVFLQRPLRWLEAIARAQATTSGGPNFAYDLCVRRTTPEQRAALDLSSWRVAFNGAEPIRPDTLDRFAAAFAPSGFRRDVFYPCYGLAESTLLVTGGLPDTAPLIQAVDMAALGRNQVVPAAGDEGKMLVSCGQPQDSQVAIVDPDTLAVCWPAQIGEVWINGPSVAQGYWGQADASAATFAARTQADDGPFLRTGDLGFVQDGELFITGRLKDLIVVRGRNHYPQDIELTVEHSHPQVRPGAGVAFAVDVDDQERLVVVQEIDRHAQTDSYPAIMAAINEAVAAQHEIQPYAVLLVKQGSVPKTSSGKLQRQLTRRIYQVGKLEVLGQHLAHGAAASEQAVPKTSRLPDDLRAQPLPERVTVLTQYVTDLLAQALGCAPSQVDRLRPISAFGLDSLMAVELQHRVETDLGVQVPMTLFLQDTSVAQLVARLADDLERAPQTDAAQDASSNGTPLSYGQRALWFIHQLAPDSAAYHIGGALRMRPAPDLALVERVFEILVARHTALRTVFRQEGDAPVQIVLDALPPEITLIDARDWDDVMLQQRIAGSFQRPFDLQHGPLLRVQLFARDADERVLVLTIHHIVSDQQSLLVLLREFLTLYAASTTHQAVTLPPAGISYQAYATRQMRHLASPASEALRNYWTKQLASPLPVLDLPTDHPRPRAQTFAGATHPFALGSTLSAQIGALASAQQTTPFVVALAAFHALLFRYTGQNDLLVGTPTAGRDRADTANVVGYFVNPIVTRSHPRADMPFTTFLADLRRTLIDGLDHQAYPFARLVEDVQTGRDPSRSPVFQVMFNWQQAIDTILQVAALPQTMRFESLPLLPQSAQFDLSLTITAAPDRLDAAFEYNTDLFAPATIARMAAHFTTLLASLVATPDAKLGRATLLPNEERAALLAATVSAVPSTPSTLPALIAAQAARTPDAPALVVGAATLSYGELDARAGMVAAQLVARGIGPDQCVGVCLGRSADLVVTLLGVLKAGAAYVPIDPNYPAARVAAMLEDARAALVVSEPATAAVLQPDTPSVTLAELHAAVANNTPLPAVVPDQLAYVIYTSGSTGRPKGVAITHASAAELVGWASATFRPEELTGVLASTSVCFDLSVFEIFVPLSLGTTVILIENLLHLPECPAAERVTLINTVPSAMGELLRLRAVPPSVRTVNLAGEPLPGALVQQIYRDTLVERVYNLYGPSEDTTYSTVALIARDEVGIPSIGRPVRNTRAYLLDPQGELAPTGVPGELYLAGAGLARGYLGQPGQTAVRFLPDPWSATPGARMYRTGDRVRLRQDSQLEFLGRLDHQVKVRGFRIELGEIEAVLAQHPAVRDSVVVLREDRPGDQRLVAYLVLGDAGPDDMDWRAWVRKTLPDYMVPSAVVVLSALPLTPNGKIDRRALPAPTSSGVEDADYAAPQGAIEKQLAALWQELLGVLQVGRTTNFFALGGHSLLATQLLARIRTAFHVDLSVRRMFEGPTIAEIAQLIGEAQQRAPSSDDALDVIRPVRRAATRRTTLADLLADAPSEATSAQTDDAAKTNMD